MSFRDNILYAMSGSLKAQTVAEVVIAVIRHNNLQDRERARNQARIEIRQAIIDLQREGKIASCGKRIWLPKSR